MKHFLSMLVAAAATLAPWFAAAQSTDPTTMRPPSVAVTASATATLTNDRMYAWLRVEKEDASAANAAADVNARMARVQALVRSETSIEAASAGYSTQQIVDKDKPRRWRVSQTLRLAGSDFAVLAAMTGKLQEQGVLLDGLGYGLSQPAHQRAEDDLMREAIKAWQSRARTAADALGYASWRVGSVQVQTNDGTRPMMMRAEMMSMGAMAAQPVAVEAGTTDVTVSVSGDAVLEAKR
jgi:predicted secreted protein